MLTRVWGENAVVDTMLTSVAELRALSNNQLKQCLFDAIKALNIPLVRNVFLADRTLINCELHGFEGADIYNSIPDSRTTRCYTYTGVAKDGFFSPLHVAAERGDKYIIMLMVRAGCDQSAKGMKKKEIFAVFLTICIYIYI